MGENKKIVAMLGHLIVLILRSCAWIVFWTFDFVWIVTRAIKVINEIEELYSNK